MKTISAPVAAILAAVLGVGCFLAGQQTQRYTLTQVERGIAIRLDRLTGKTEGVLYDGSLMSDAKNQPDPKPAEKAAAGGTAPASQADPFADLRHFEKLAHGPEPIPTREQPKEDPLATFEPKPTSP